MKIGELAKVAHCSVETIRYYEKEALLPQTARSEGNSRVYGAAHVERLRFIRNCRNLDMSHEEIHALLALTDKPQDGCGGINDVFDQHIAHVDQTTAHHLTTALPNRPIAARLRYFARTGGDGN